MNSAIMIIGITNRIKVLKKTVEDPYSINPVSCKKHSRDIVLSGISPTAEITPKNYLRL